MSDKSGQCLCGAVKFKATPKSQEVGVCHCEMCRKNNAGPFFAVDCGDTLTFENEENLGVYASSAWAERVFCKSCGSSIVWRMKDKSMNIVALDLIDGLDQLVLDHEVFIDEKPGYYSFAEKTKQMTGAQLMEMFAGGGSGE
jgi:Uncharacterized conserved protein